MAEQFAEEVLEEPRLHDMMELFDELSFSEKWAKVSEGLKQPQDSGDYKWAKFQVKRLWAPACAIVVPFILIFTVGLLAAFTPEAQPVVEVQIMEPEPVEELDDIIEEIIPPPEPPEPEEVDPDIISDVPFAGADPTEAPGPVADFSPQPTPFDAVAIIKSPVIMRGIYGSRSPGARGAAIAGGGGGSAGEFAVLRALRWLKKNQSSEGSWDAPKPAMTALALLTFLAHGETPSSEEFGLTVEMAIKYLLESAGTGSGKLKGTDGHEYSFPIVAYALCEAYGMTQIPDIKYVAEKMIERIVKGQHPSGGWDYNLKQNTRDDTSYMGWCAQALKAAKAAYIEVEGLEKACKLSVKGFQKNFAGNYDGGGFGYTSPSANHGLSPIGTLCMQLHGAAQETEVLGSLNTYDKAAKWQTYDIDNPAPGKDGLYYWYYLTQAKFQAGGERWNKWNKLFSPELVRKQIVQKKEVSGYVDHKGVARSIGNWDQYTGHGACPVFATCLATLQLEVYYRYLPTFKTADGGGPAADAPPPPDRDNNDVKIDITI